MIEVLIVNSDVKINEVRITNLNSYVWFHTILWFLIKVQQKVIGILKLLLIYVEELSLDNLFIDERIMNVPHDVSTSVFEV